jgi:hypothetical protein
MIPAHRFEAVLSEDGKLSLEHLPFRAGQTVEVIVLPAATRVTPQPPESLRGSVLKYDRPFDPAVPEDDWEALK